MSDSLIETQLIFHGTVALVVGLLSGAPMGSAINKNKGEDSVRAWRVAHSGLILGALLLYALAFVIPYLQMGELYGAISTWSFILSAYGFIAALPLGAVVGERGLRSTRGIGQLVYFGNMVGAGGALIGAVPLLLFSFIRAFL